MDFKSQEQYVFEKINFESDSVVQKGYYSAKATARISVACTKLVVEFPVLVSEVPDEQNPSILFMN